MHYKIVNGSYVPCYMLIKLKETNASLTQISNIHPNDRKTFFHEYTHFLQEITGGFGHSHIWYTFNRMRHMAAELRKNSAEEITIPLNNTASDYQDKLANIQKDIEGSNHVPKGLNDKIAYIYDASSYTNKNFRELFPGNQVSFLNINLKNGKEDKNKYPFHFGGRAVSETMAYLMEEKLFETNSATPNYPYRACQRVGNYLETDFTENKEWLFALCDLAMCCPYPGMAFYTMLLDFTNSGFKPKSSEEIYVAGEQTLRERGWNIWEIFEKNKNEAVQVMKDLFTHPVFTETLGWIVYILETGFQYRRNEPHFMLDLFRANSGFEGRWSDMYRVFGTPQLHNQEFKRFFQAPEVMKNIQERIEPLFLLSMKEVHDTLYDGKSRCGLLECCNNSEKGPKPDYRCVIEPWEWAKEASTCAYGGQWTLLGLSEKKIV